MKIGIGRMIYGIILIVLGLLMLSLLVSCDDNDSAGQARLEVRLTDAPGIYEQVNVDIQDVQVNTGDDDSESGWQSLVITKGVYDLMTLTNGIDTLLGFVDLPAGKISQIRLVLGSNNTVKIGGELLPLSTPSAQQSGLKVQVHQELKEGITYKILLDFDAALSIVAKGNGEYSLKPVIRSVTEAVDGAIEGSVQPIDSQPVVYAIIGTDTVSTSANVTTGDFMIRGLQSGSYRVVFIPHAGYASKEITNVQVNVGTVTEVGIVQIPAL